MDAIDELCKAGRWKEALDALQAALARGADAGDGLLRHRCPEWYRHVLGRECLLLEAARNCRDAPADILQGIKAIGADGGPLHDLLEGEFFDDEAQQSQHIKDGYLGLLDARIALTEAALGNCTPDDLSVLLRRAIDQYTTHWNFDPVVANFGGGPIAGEPSYLARLPNDRWRGVFRALAADESIGPLHPGLLLAGETIAYLHTDQKDLPLDYKVCTWVLLANTENQRGVLGRLHLERVPGGCGAMVPHPLAGGYRLTEASFQQGLQHAWLAVQGQLSPDERFDVRWWINVADPVDARPIDCRLSGRSAELAIACGLKALSEQEPLDDLTAITASFRDPAKGDFSVDPVAAVWIKATVGKLSEILVVSGQEVAYEDQPVTIGRTEQTIRIGAHQITLDPIRDLEDAYERLSRWPRMTHKACAKIVDRETEQLRQWCGTAENKINYVLSSLSREAPLEARREMPDGVRDNWQPLSKEEVRQVTRAQLHDNTSVRLIADSGLGKSTLLAYCSRQNARQADGRLPLRLDRLSGYDWRTPHLLLATLAGELEPLLPETLRKHAQQWFARLVRQGRVVFLLDALDQTTNLLEGIEIFFDAEKGTARNCPVLLTGRPSMLHDRQARVFGTRRWATLRVDPFDEPRQRKYLGPQAAARLLPKENASWDRPPGYDRWRDLLGVPLLLKLLKLLADSGQLDSIRNRHSLYARAVQHLYDKGTSSLRETHLATGTLPLAHITALLGQTAWQMVNDAAVGFTDRIAGNDFALLIQSLGEITVDRLKQINLLTVESIFDEAGDSALAWRHRSFCEYFAGRHLANLAADEQTRVVQQHARDPQWRWVFRFALSEADAESKDQKLTEAQRDGFDASLRNLSQGLIRYGNPFLLYDAIGDDKIDLADPELENLCRWLVHRDWPFLGADYPKAWDDSRLRPQANSRTLSLLCDLFSREYRNSACLHPAWELLEAADDAEARKIQKSFLAEFPAILANPAHANHRTAARMVREVTGAEDDADPYRTGFVRCPRDQADDSQAFRMGSTEEDDTAHDDERPLHAVVVSPFWMKRTAVTNAEYELFDPGHHYERNNFSGTDGQPAVWVNWYMASMFCLWLGPEYRLPTEAEREYATRAGTTTRWYFSDEEERLGDYAWYGKNSKGRSHVVGTLLPNPWGLYDMHGNVWEWCADWYGDYEMNEEPAVDPPGPDSGDMRVLRGGSWLSNARDPRSAYRGWLTPVRQLNSVGFRLARTRIR